MAMTFLALDKKEEEEEEVMEEEEEEKEKEEEEEGEEGEEGEEDKIQFNSIIKEGDLDTHTHTLSRMFMLFDSVYPLIFILIDLLKNFI